MNTNHYGGPRGPQPTGSQNTFSNHPQSKSRTRLDYKKSRVADKSEMCLQFRRGKCNYGDKCHFSHGTDGSRNSGFNAAGMKLKECHWFSSGVDCPFGDKCQFLHKFDGKIGRDVNLGTDQWGMDAGGAGDKVPSWKTKLCLKWERLGSCHYGVNCSFAHGKAELQELYSPADTTYSGYASPSKLTSKPFSGASHEPGSKMLQLKRKRCFSEWDIEWISRIYADWKEDRQILLLNRGM